MSRTMGKQTLRSKVIVNPKKDGGRGPANPSLGMTTTIKLYSAAFIDYILPGNPSFGMTTTKILGHIFPWHGSYIVAPRVEYTHCP